MFVFKPLRDLYIIMIKYNCFAPVVCWKVILVLFAVNICITVGTRENKFVFNSLVIELFSKFFFDKISRFKYH